MFIIAYGILAQDPGNNLFALQKTHPAARFHVNSELNRVLITLARKFLVVTGQPQVIEPNLSLNEKDIAQLHRIVPAPVQLYIFPLKLKIITFNLAGNAQTNYPAGSEKILVQQCQARYPQYHGWSAPPKPGQVILSQCTLNAAQWLAAQSPTIIGLQESVSSYLPLIIKTINDFTGRSYRTIGSGTTQFIYDADLLGSGQLLSPSELYILQKGRPLIIVWFPQVHLLAVNLHAPHQVDLKSAVENTFNSVPITVSPRRIIVTGDFNDAYYPPLTELQLLGMKLVQPGPPSRSCCTDTAYQLVGDYIFDSAPTSGFYGIPPSALADLMSDHHPVVYEE